MQVIFAVASLLAVAEAWSSPSTTCEVKTSMVSPALLQSRELTIAQTRARARARARANRLPLARSSSTRAPTHISKFRKCKITRPTASRFEVIWEIYVAKGTGWIHIFKNGGTSVFKALERADMNTTWYSGTTASAWASAKDSLNLQDLFLATVIQDPLHRALSGLHEALKRKYCEDIPCAPHPKSKSEWVAEFRHYVQNYVHGTQDSTDEVHFLSQASFLAGVDGVKYPVDYIGDLANLEEEVKSAFHLETLNLTVEHGPKKETLDPNLFRLEVKDLPDDLVKLACEAYRDDYCCFDLSIPETCDIDC